MAHISTGGHIHMDPGVLGLAEKFDFNGEENSLDHVHAVCTYSGVMPQLVSDPDGNTHSYSLNVVSVGGGPCHIRDSGRGGVSVGL